MKLKTTTGNTPAIQSDANGSFSSYHIVPSTYTKVATLTPITTTNQNSSFGATYAAYAAGTQTAGTYNGKVKYTLVHPANGEVQDGPKSATAGCISYFPNAGNDVIDNMGDQCVNQDNQTLTNNMTNVMLWPTNFKREGYGFAGWSDQFDYQINSNTNTGHIYGPMESITTPSDLTTNGLSLYAVWVPSRGNLQKWNGCGSLAKGEVTALTDTRDNNTYAVAKLADNQCWMIENLRLADKDTDNNTIILSTDNTNNPSLPLTNTWYFNNSTQTIITSNSLSTPTSPFLTGWCTGVNANCIDQSMLSTDNTTNTVANMTSPNSDNVYSYGNYYNWYSATAGYGRYTNSTNNQNADGDICPIGWSLPQGGDKTKIESGHNNFWNLIAIGLNNDTKPTNYDNSTRPYYTGTEATPIANLLVSFPNNFVYSGYLDGSSIDSKNATGLYWTNTVYEDSSAYILSSSNMFRRVSPGTAPYSKYEGIAVRCVAIGYAPQY